jgi:palmitoyltransferase
LRWCAVAMVLLLITSMAGCGILTLLPLLCTTWPTYAPNLLVAVLLLLEICFNYAAAVAQHAGRVSDHTSPPPARSPDGYVPQGSLQHWSWCMHCQAAKPPQAHHCRTCRSCVVNMVCSRACLSGWLLCMRRQTCTSTPVTCQQQQDSSRTTFDSSVDGMVHVL